MFIIIFMHYRIVLCDEDDTIEDDTIEDVYKLNNISATTVA